jgi:cytochrome c oxidase cbb3-type subunit III
VTVKGEKITGMMRVNDNFSLSIQTLDGAYRFLPKSELAQVDFGSRSLMPAGSTLDGKEVDDLVSYLLRAGDENSRRSPAHSSKADDEDN